MSSGLKIVEVISEGNSDFSTINFRDSGYLYDVTFGNENGGYYAILEGRTSDNKLCEDDGEVTEFMFYGTTAFETAREIREILET